MANGEAHEACGIDQLCGELQPGTEGGVHDMHSLWDQSHGNAVGDTP